MLESLDKRVPFYIVRLVWYLKHFEQTHSQIPKLTQYSSINLMAAVNFDTGCFKYLLVENELYRPTFCSVNVGYTNTFFVKDVMRPSK